MDEDIKKLVEENIRLTREVHTMMKKVRRYMAVKTTMSLIYFILLVAPIIIAFIYLPPLLKPYLQQYQQLLGGFSNSNTGSEVNNITTTPGKLTVPDLLNLAETLGLSLPDQTVQE